MESSRTIPGRSKPNFKEKGGGRRIRSCLPCNILKRKCDRGKPVCGPCMAKKMGFMCSWNGDDGKPSKGKSSCAVEHHAASQALPGHGVASAAPPHPWPTFMMQTSEDRVPDHVGPDSFTGSDGSQEKPGHDGDATVHSLSPSTSQEVERKAKVFMDIKLAVKDQVPTTTSSRMVFELAVSQYTPLHAIFAVGPAITPTELYDFYGLWQGFLASTTEDIANMRIESSEERQSLYTSFIVVSTFTFACTHSNFDVVEYSRRLFDISLALLKVLKVCFPWDDVFQMERLGVAMTLLWRSGSPLHMSTESTIVVSDTLKEFYDWMLCTGPEVMKSYYSMKIVAALAANIVNPMSAMMEFQQELEILQARFLGYMEMAGMASGLPQVLATVEQADLTRLKSLSACILGMNVSFSLKVMLEEKSQCLFIAAQPVSGGGAGGAGQGGAGSGAMDPGKMMKIVMSLQMVLDSMVELLTSTMEVVKAKLVQGSFMDEYGVWWDQSGCRFNLHYTISVLKALGACWLVRLGKAQEGKGRLVSTLTDWVTGMEEAAHPFNTVLPQNLLFCLDTLAMADPAVFLALLDSSKLLSQPNLPSLLTERGAVLHRQVLMMEGASREKLKTNAMG